LSTKKRLFSDKKITIDKAGRLRVGGRFASKRQIGNLQGARKRRGLEVVPVQRSTPKPKRTNKGKTKASRAAIKGAKTRKLNSEGVERREYVTDRARYQNVEFNLPVIDAEVIRTALERESVDNKRLLIYSKIRALDSDNNEIVIGTPMLIVEMQDLQGMSEIVAEDMRQVAEQYLVAEILEITVTISKGR